MLPAFFFWPVALAGLAREGATMIRIRLILTAAVILVASPALALPVCEGGDRAARKLTCIVDGDTGWEVGVKWRLLDIDTPEISSPECDAEYAAGIAARDKLRDLMGRGYRIEWSGEAGYFGRDLVRVRLSDGRLAGDTLIADGLAQRWPNEGNIWCGR